MASLTESQVRKLEKKTTAQHEAGHATVAAVFGYRPRCWVVENENGSMDGERFFTGRTECQSFCASIAVAGLVAESISELDLSCEIDQLADEIIDWWMADVIGPSPTDLKYIPDDWDSRLEAVSEALRVIIEYKKLFDWLVSEMVSHNVVTDGAIADYLRAINDENS